MATLEDTLSYWAKGPGQTEKDKCDNAYSAISNAISSDSRLQKYNITVFPQGSYRARTNISKDSDVDICVCLHDAFFADYPEGMTKEQFGNVDGSIKYIDFKNMVGTALVNYFGANSVTRGNKAFDLHENSYRIDADVVPAFEYRRYTGKKTTKGEHHYLEGIKFNPDKGSSVINWPEQTYDNGIAKNDRTGRIYKRVIRILKNLRNFMQDNKIQQDAVLPSFLIESLVWNMPDQYFLMNTYTEVVNVCLKHLLEATLNESYCSEWGEVNELKYLFRSTQPWTMQQVNSFMGSALTTLGMRVRL